MKYCRSDFTLTEALSDPVIRMVMKADGVDRDQLEQSLVSLAAQISTRQSAQVNLCCE
jgi:hypothetical protein